MVDNFGMRALLAAVALVLDKSICRCLYPDSAVRPENIDHPIVAAVMPADWEHNFPRSRTAEVGVRRIELNGILYTDVCLVS